MEYYNNMDGRETQSDWRVGLITHLSEVQSEVLAIIRDSREAEDKTLEDGLVSNLPYKDETVAAVVLAHKEIRDPDGEINQMDILWAGTFLDHLDTMGYRVRRKK